MLIFFIIWISDSGNDASVADHRVFEVSDVGLRVWSSDLFEGNRDQMEREAEVWEHRTDDGDV